MNLISVYCFLPLIPLFVVTWLLQRSATRTVEAASKKAVEVVSKDALEKFLSDSGLEKIDVVKSSSYVQNEFDEKENKIYLSPETFESIDLGSLALALRAGAQAITVREQTGFAAVASKFRGFQTLFFWLAFGVLAFGIMSGQLATSGIGYLIALASWLCGKLKRDSLKKIDDVAVEFVRKSELLPSDALEALERTLSALRKL